MSDDKVVLGLRKDYKTLRPGQARDNYENFLMTYILEICGRHCSPYISISFQEIDGKDVCITDVSPSNKPVFIKDEKRDSFYVRAGNTSTPLSHEETP